MSKSNKELAVEIYCASMIANALVYPHLEKKPASAVPDPRDYVFMVDQIADELAKIKEP